MKPMVLELDLTEPPVLDPGGDPLTLLRTRHRVRLRDILDGLRRAAADADVVGLVVKLGGHGPGLAIVQELRPAIRAFRRGGKPALAWSETFGEFAPGNAGYCLATAFDEIWLGESGDLGLTGVGLEATFVRDALDRLGVSIQLGQRHEYKNAANMFLESDLTPAHREAAQRLVHSAYDQLVGDVAADRGLPADRVRELVDTGPLSADEAETAGLIDRIGYRDEVHARLRERVGRDYTLRYLTRYQHAARSQASRYVNTRLATRRDGEIALVHASGPIQLGRSGATPLGSAMGSTTVAAALRSAVAAEQVKAIVLRVDSPGGSYAASDIIRREVVLARRAGKPVVVSMGSMAGSGGYFIAMAADVLVALPATLTGSIGVFGGKLVLERALSRAGISTGPITAGAHALMFSHRAPFSAGEWELMQRWLDRVYADFTAKVAHDRGMSAQRVHEIARGRVWTGVDARGLGLIDELGGLETAIRVARERAGLPPRNDSTGVRVYPQRSPMDRITPPESSDEPQSASSWGGFDAVAARLGLPGQGPLLMPFAIGL